MPLPDPFIRSKRFCTCLISYQNGSSSQIMSSFSFIHTKPITTSSTFSSPTKRLSRSKTKPFPPLKCSAHPLLNHNKAQRHFLRHFWNKRPCLLRNLLPSYQCPVTGDDLAALSSDQAHDARIIQTLPTCPPSYTLQLGPFDHDSSVWSSLPSTNWTLLVQRLERSVPRAVSLLDQFSFLPHWRIADVQASYAVHGGGVGPHVDNYDVFLVQAHGKRTWHVSYTPLTSQQERHILVTDSPVRVIESAHFQIDETFQLCPGDVLYVPPRFIHHGVAVDDECITLSVGFRAPNAAHLASRWLEHCIHMQKEHDADELYFTDDVDDLIEGLSSNGNIRTQQAGKLSHVATDRAFDIVQKLMFRGRHGNDAETRREFAQWFSQEMSISTVYNDMDEEMEEDEEEEEEQQDFEEIFHAVFHCTEPTLLHVRQRPGSVFLYTQSTDDDSCTLCIDGDTWTVEHAEIAQFLCSKRCIPCSDYTQFSKQHDSFQSLVRQLFDAELLHVIDMDDDEYDEEALLSTTDFGHT